MTATSRLAPRVLLLMLLELTYASGTRIVLPLYFYGVELELWTTTLRVASASACWLLFHDLIRSRHADVPALAHPLSVAGILLLWSTMLLVGRVGLPDATTKIVFALTSIPVAIREELVYRGVVQNLFVLRLGGLGAVFAADALFVLYHFGAQPFTAPYIIGLFAAGGVFGLVYAGSGSLAAAIAVHAAYDAIETVTPVLSRPWPLARGNVLQLIAMLLVLAWALTGRTRTHANEG